MSIPNDNYCSIPISTELHRKAQFFNQVKFETNLCSLPLQQGNINTSHVSKASQCCFSDILTWCILQCTIIIYIYKYFVCHTKCQALESTCIGACIWSRRIREIRYGTILCQNCNKVCASVSFCIKDLSCLYSASVRSYIEISNVLSCWLDCVVNLKNL